VRSAAALLLALAFVACGGEDRGDRADPAPDGGAEVQTHVTGLEAPWEMAFLPDGSALVTERPGRVRLVSAEGELRPEPVAEIDVTALGEGGLLGLALDPDFEENRFVYLYYTRGDAMVLARYRFEDDRLEEQATLLDDVRAGAIHDGGRIRFGPDDRLYVATGDAGQAELAQQPESLNGKFLRLEPQQYRGAGGAPEILTSGHRNPQGFDWQPGTDRLVASEHGPAGDDEINEIQPGGNYGWPEAQGRDHGGFAAPLVVYDETIAPSGAAFVTRPGSEWTGDLLVAALAGEQLRRVRLDGSRVTVDEPLFEGTYGRLRTVVEGPDGALYVLTSNRDGRGSPEEGDDRIVRIVPPAR
jgi:glucose/arabinose dehydrogenase